MIVIIYRREGLRARSRLIVGAVDVVYASDVECMPRMLPVVVVVEQPSVCGRGGKHERGVFVEARTTTTVVALVHEVQARKPLLL
jgi:hypothetical protein